MKKDKYLGYWKDKTCNCFYQVLWKFLPRLRYVTSYTKIGNRFSKIGRGISVDYLRIKCEKITEDTFKEYTKCKL